MTRRFPADPEQAPDRKLIAGLAKLGMALKSQAWQGASQRGLTPTQGQALTLLMSKNEPIRLSDLAALLGVTPATASECVGALAGKGLLTKRQNTSDRRVWELALTAQGRKAAKKAADWPDFLLEGVASLSPVEQEVFLRGVLKMIHSLQARGLIAPSRLCLTCVHFKPFVHAGATPHHCAFVDAPFAGADLRLDCPDHSPASTAQADQTWARFQKATA